MWMPEDWEDRSRSPLTPQERDMIIMNEETKRSKIETELEKIPVDQRRNLMVYMKCSNNPYVKQEIEVRVFRRNEIMNEKGFQYFRPETMMYPKVWLDFNHDPFYPTCVDCHNIIRSYYGILNRLCKSCEVKKIYLTVPYKDKDEAKKYGCKWDPTISKWYVNNTNLQRDVILTKWKKAILASSTS